MIKSVDQLQNEIEIRNFPLRIISTVPSQTELLSDLGLDKEVVGITKFCIHPNSWFRDKQRIGGTKNLNFDKICSLLPNLIIANKEENDKNQIDALRIKFPVWVSDIKSMEDALKMILEISRITNRIDAGLEIVRDCKTEFEKLQSIKIRYSCAYLIWKNPIMTIGGDTFISNMMYHTGLTNVFSDRDRYPEISLSDLKNKKPDVIILSSEPYHFKEKDIAELQTSLPGIRIIIADGELFSWYGSRMIKAPSYFMTLRDIINSAL